MVVLFLNFGAHPCLPAMGLPQPGLGSHRRVDLCVLPRPRFVGGMRLQPAYRRRPFRRKNVFLQFLATLLAPTVRPRLIVMRSSGMPPRSAALEFYS